ncbi:hypothetical protein [Paenibacillus dakarensis]|uniref:hypothetical protein n=1 Tax=Paenibacillus dakarensis TaxID=1527293 RepID=UPI0006D535B1|nr:hypothetical protein [Paenibacillus dakarensis]
MDFLKKSWKEKRTKFEIELLHKAQGMSESNPPSPWLKEVIVPASGCLACGWDQNENLVLISSSGYSITEVSSGTRIHRDRDSKLTDKSIRNNNLSFHSPYNGEVIDIFGFEAGDGIHTTNDGWFIQVIYPWWPRASVIIENLYKLNYQYLNDATMIELKRLDGDLKCGFAPSGKSLVILGSGGALIYSRL